MVDPHAPPPPPPPPAPAFEPPKKKRHVWLIVLLAVGIPVSLVALCVGAGALFLLTAKELPFGPDERACVVTAQELAGWFEFEPDAQHEVEVKRRYIDRSYELEYEYDDPADEAPYVICTVSVERNSIDARQTYRLSLAADSAALSMWGLKKTVRNDLLRWGDESEFATLEYEGEPAGHLFVARRGKRVFSLILTNGYFDDAASIGELFGPVLESVARYEP